VSDALFSPADVWDGDPLNPDTETVTPTEIVASLTPSERRQRVHALMRQANDIAVSALRVNLRGREHVASCLLFSGGNDSTVLAHLFRDDASHAIHANTTIGIEQTRQFVRDTCADWGLPLIEVRAPIAYRDLVIEQGFPGPAMHWKMYQRLKERALDLARHELGVAGRRSKAALFLAGRRRAESERRADVPLHENDGSVIWASPLAMWTKLDLNTYREIHPDVPRNEVSDLLHMSGECLCGAFAKPGELDAIGEWFPEVRAEIEDLERDVAAAGHPKALCKWGHGLTGAQLGEMRTGRLCTSCQVPGQLDLLGGDAA
jgi:3'-phosphoadenosine 5'-phosphosulfate sulfotransferase (PAPS reductase)/FAD synthetase